jgi:hypothetical protein
MHQMAAWKLSNSSPTYRRYLEGKEQSVLPFGKELRCKAHFLIWLSRSVGLNLEGWFRNPPVKQKQLLVAFLLSVSM